MDIKLVPDVSVQSVLRMKGFAWSLPFPSVTAEMVRLSQYLEDTLKLYVRKRDSQEQKRQRGAWVA